MSRRHLVMAVAFFGLVGWLVSGCAKVPFLATAPTPTTTITKTPKPTFTPLATATLYVPPSEPPSPTLPLTPTPTFTPTATVPAEDVPPPPDEPDDAPIPPESALGLSSPTISSLPTLTPEELTTQAPSASPVPVSTEPSSERPEPSAVSGIGTADDGYPFQAQLLQWEPNCAGTGLKGSVLSSTGQKVNAGQVRILLYENVIWVPVGFGAQGPGGWDWPRFQGAERVPLLVSLWSDDRGTQLSGEIQLTTDMGYCGPGGSGHQVGTVNFVCKEPESCG